MARSAGGGAGRDARRRETPEPPAMADGGPVGPSRCTGCQAPALTRLPMVLTDGTDVVFVSCQTCERREWFEPALEGHWEAIPIDSVLARSSRRR